MPPKRPATSSTTVCVMEPVFAQHTDCPTVIVTEDGVNAYSVAATVTAAPLLADAEPLTPRLTPPARLICHHKAPQPCN